MTGTVKAFPSLQGFTAVLVTLDRQYVSASPAAESVYPLSLLTPLAGEQLTFTDEPDAFVCGPDDIDETAGQGGDAG
jgi:hypothetical protein